MKLNPATFNKFLDEKGQNILWYKSIRCPCFDHRSGEALLSCSVCSGKGSTFLSPSVSRLAFSGADIQKKWEQMGRVEAGDIVASLGSNQSVYAVGLEDKITLTDSTIPFTWVGIFGSPLGIHDLVSIDSVHIISDGNLVSETVTYSSGNLVWANEPPLGTQYTIRGRKHPSYYVYTDLPRDRAHFGGLSLPRLVVLRVLDLSTRL